MEVLIGVLTISDRVHQKQAEDLSGPKILEIFKSRKDDFKAPLKFLTKVVPDEITQIQNALLDWTDKHDCHLILTTGGTGFTPRDITPEATKLVIEREAPAITTAMFVDSLKVTPHAMLSRAVAGIRKRTLIVNLPGSPKAVKENLETILPALPHAIGLIRNVPQESMPSSHHSHDKTNAQNNHYSTHTHSHSHSRCESGNHSGGKRKTSPWPMIPINDAVQIILDEVGKLEHEVIPVEKSLGRIVFEDVKANDPLPPFRASVKDGYAVCSQDGAGKYEVIGTVTAGTLPSFKVSPGKIARITTGSPVPDGADAIVMVENTELEQIDDHEYVTIFDAVKPGTDIRPIGIDVSIGQVVLQKYDRIGAPEMGMMATIGVTQVSVFKAPQIGVLSTGDELNEPKEELSPGHIRDSNRSMLLSAIEDADAGFRSGCIDLGIARDNEQDLMKSVVEGLQKCDVVITTGGVSMGELDLIQPILQKLGKIHFGRVLMKPGKPFTFATVEMQGKKKLFFGLPGNPVSGLVTFYLLVLPAIRKLAGYTDQQIPLTRILAKVDQPFKLDPERPEYHRVTLNWKMSRTKDNNSTKNVGADGQSGHFLATSTGSQASHRLMSMRSANALLLIPQGEGKLEPGSFAPALLIGKL